MAKHTLNELGNMSPEELITIILSMQGQLDALNENIEKLIEQVRLANSYRFGRHTETLKSIDGQLSFFDEAETLFDASAQEPSVEEAVVVTRKKKIQRPAGTQPEGISGRSCTGPFRVRGAAGCLLWERLLAQDAG